MQQLRAPANATFALGVTSERRGLRIYMCYTCEDL